MGLEGALRAIARPLALARGLPPHLPRSAPPASGVGSIASFAVLLVRPVPFPFPWATSAVPVRSIFHSLTDTRFPKRRPGTAPRRKRASLRPPGPYAWVQSVPGEPMPRSQPNKGSVKARGRKEKKRIKQRKAFILSEKKKRKAQYAESRRKKSTERIERKMAAVAREKAWAQRLIELQQLEAANKAATSS
ncbi:hypothetical protein Taro_014239 [Colocasia esculenta]|uniref:Uncharacterized protein n=1 Tax=Colocasia esculenta TaxID=4460 RepID=A0A843UL79_COLES|nr:hypothetical protein [Colocasia esculenta]